MHHFPDNNSTPGINNPWHLEDLGAPAHKPGIAVIGDVKAFFGMARFVPDVLGGFAFAGSGPGFVGGDATEDT